MAKYRLLYDGDSFVDGFEVDSIETGLELGLEIMSNWLSEQLNHMNYNGKQYAPTGEEIAEWDYMIDSCCVWVEDEETEDEYYPSEEQLDEIGWFYWEVRECPMNGN